MKSEKKKAVDREKRSEESLCLIFDEFKQEVISLRMTADAYNQIRSKSWAPNIVRNSLILSSAIHFRNTYDFLYSGSAARATDAIAEDFFPNPSQWQKTCPAKSDYLKEMKTITNQLFAHITYKRTDFRLDKISWDFARIMKELLPAIAFFDKVAPPRIVGSGLEGELNHKIWQYVAKKSN